MFLSSQKICSVFPARSAILNHLLRKRESASQISEVEDKSLHSLHYGINSVTPFLDFNHYIQKQILHIALLTALLIILRSTLICTIPLPMKRHGISNWISHLYRSTRGLPEILPLEEINPSIPILFPTLIFINIITTFLIPGSDIILGQIRR